MACGPVEQRGQPEAGGDEQGHGDRGGAGADGHTGHAHLPVCALVAEVPICAVRSPTPELGGGVDRPRPDSAPTIPHLAAKAAEQAEYEAKLAATEADEVQP